MNIFLTIALIVLNTLIFGAIFFSFARKKDLDKFAILYFGLPYLLTTAPLVCDLSFAIEQGRIEEDVFVYLKGRINYNNNSRGIDHVRIEREKLCRAAPDGFCYAYVWPNKRSNDEYLYPVVYNVNLHHRRVYLVTYNAEETKSVRDGL